MNLNPLLDSKGNSQDYKSWKYVLKDEIVDVSTTLYPR